MIGIHAELEESLLSECNWRTECLMWKISSGRSAGDVP
jgi:hypothetical protein